MSSYTQWIPFVLACRLHCLKQGSLGLGNTQQRIQSLLNDAITEANGGNVDDTTGAELRSTWYLIGDKVLLEHIGVPTDLEQAGAEAWDNFFFEGQAGLAPIGAWARWNGLYATDNIHALEIFPAYVPGFLKPPNS